MKRTTKLIASLALVFGLAALAYPAYAADDDTWTPADGARTVDEGEPVVTSAAPAAPAISIKPTNEYVTFGANDSVEKQFTITNAGSAPFDFKVYAEPYTINDEGDDYTFAFNTTNSHSEISKWVSFLNSDGAYTDTATFHVEAGEAKVITYRVATPEKVAAGGQYAALFAETVNKEAEEGNINGIYTVSRVALLLYGRSSEGAVAESSITDYSVPSFMLAGPITASSRVSSTGNVDVTATYRMTVRSIFGEDLYSNTWSYPVLPDTSRYVVMTWEDTPAFGLFSVTYSVSTTSIIEDRTTIVLILPVWMIILAILLLTFIGFWITISIKKRKERKSRLIV